MSVTPLPAWDVTAIEIALALEIPRFADPSCLVFSGPAEPRICLVAGFAVSAQLKRIVAAVERTIPARLPSRLRIVPASSRAIGNALSVTISIQPMLSLMRLQSRLIRAIEPGLAHNEGHISSRQLSELGESTAHFIWNFVANKTLPTFEPPRAAGDFASTPVRAVGVAMYRLGQRGAPQSILREWAYPTSIRTNLHLRSGP